MADRSRRFGLPVQLLTGLLVILVGLILLADTTGVYDTRALLDFVPSLFALLGLYALVRSRFRNVFGPGMAVVAAGAWQLVALDVLEWSEVWQFWPLALVFFGLSIVLTYWRKPARRGVDVAHVTGLGVFSGSELRSTSDSFTGADLTAAFGGVELDLRDAEVADPPAHVTVTAMFGGVDLIVPRDWRVEVDVLPIFGGVEDDRLRETGGDATTDADEVDLVVTGFVAFGGVSLNS